MELRPLLATDAASIHQSLLGDPEVTVWLRADAGTFTLAECEEFVVRKVAHRDAHGFGTGSRSSGAELFAAGGCGPWHA